jgi:hypothetical protein
MTSQHGTQFVKTHNRTTQKKKRWTKRTPIKNRVWTQMLAKCNHFVFLIRHPPCYSYIMHDDTSLEHDIFVSIEISDIVQSTDCIKVFLIAILNCLFKMCHFLIINISTKKCDSSILDVLQYPMVRNTNFSCIIAHMIS